MIARNALDQAYDLDRLFFLGRPDRQHRARRATAAEVTMARASDPDCVTDPRFGATWFALVKVLSRDPLLLAVVYMRGPRNLDLRTATDGKVAATHARLTADAARQVASRSLVAGWP